MEYDNINKENRKKVYYGSLWGEAITLTIFGSLIIMPIVFMVPF